MGVQVLACNMLVGCIDSVTVRYPEELKTVNITALLSTTMSQQTIAVTSTLASNMTSAINRTSPVPKALVPKAPVEATALTPAVLKTIQSAVMAAVVTGVAVAVGVAVSTGASAGGGSVLDQVTSYPCFMLPSIPHSLYTPSTQPAHAQPSCLGLKPASIFHQYTARGPWHHHCACSASSAWHLMHGTFMMHVHQPSFCGHQILLWGGVNSLGGPQPEWYAWRK